MLWDDGRRKEKREDRLPVGVRLPKSLFDYVKDRSGEARGELTRVIEEMVRFDKHLHDRLASDRIRIQKFALDEGLNWPGQAPEVFARLILRGLDAKK